MSELALAVFAASATRTRTTGRGAEPRSRRSSTASTSGGARAARGGRDPLGRARRARLPAAAALDPRPAAGAVPPRRTRDPALLDRPVVAIVGARACSDYGAHVARSLARELAAAGVVVVSGLARGVDGWAHRGCLEAGGATVAVLGCGIDRDYPRAHSALAREIAARGLIVSEYPPGVAPAPWRFPARNRIVAGLALATVVVEARERSGALITADLALEEGRDVLAVPGEITSRPVAGLERAPPARGDARDVRGRRPRGDRAGTGRRPARRRPRPGPRRRWCSRRGRRRDDGRRGRARHGLGAGAVAAVLVELELGGLVAVSAGVVRR